MPPQVEALQRLAGRNGWVVTCEGKAGEEQVLRLSAPRKAGERYWAAMEAQSIAIASSVTRLQVGEATSTSCDREAVTGEASEPTPILLMADEVRLAALLPLARHCGFQSAHIRRRQPDDPPIPNASRSTHILDAGEDASRRQGPLLCFLHMRSMRPQNAAAVR